MQVLPINASLAIRLLAAGHHCQLVCTIFIYTDTGVLPKLPIKFSQLTCEFSHLVSQDVNCMGIWHKYKYFILGSENPILVNVCR